MKKSEVARRAIEIIQEKGWIQGNYCNAQGSVCAEGAIVLASGMAHFLEEDNDGRLDILFDNYSPEAALYRTTLTELFTFINKGSDAGNLTTIPGWNDQPGMTAEDVILGLKEVAESLEDRGE